MSSTKGEQPAPTKFTVRFTGELPQEVLIWAYARAAWRSLQKQVSDNAGEPAPKPK